MGTKTQTPARDVVFRIKHRPFPRQRKILDDPARFRTCVMGRRFGKSLTACFDAINHAALIPGATIWIVHPTYQLGQRVSDLFRSLNADPNFYRFKVSDRQMKFFNGSTVHWLSADRPENLVGAGVDLLILDECGLITPRAYYESCLPAIADKKGRVLAIGTPKHRGGVFWDLFNKGNSEEWPDYSTYQCASYENPYLDASILQALKEAMPEALYRQEIEAQWLEGQSAVFGSFDDCIRPIPEDFVPGDVILGVDLAKSEDWTVMIAMDRTTGFCFDMERFQKLDWTVVKDKIQRMAKSYNATVMLDATGVGDPILDDLRAVGLDVDGTKWTSESKSRMVQALSIAIAEREVTFPDWPILLQELQTYSFEILPSGRITYNAPPGLHDDAVAALMMCVEAQRKSPVNIGLPGW